jgi:hypothetical protein
MHLSKTVLIRTFTKAISTIAILTDISEMDGHRPALGSIVEESIEECEPKYPG